MYGELSSISQAVYERCEKLRPTLFRLAGDTIDDDDALGNGSFSLGASSTPVAKQTCCFLLCLCGARNMAKWTFGFPVLGLGKTWPKLT